MILWALAIVLVALVCGGVFLLWWWSPGENLEPWRSGRPPGPWAAWNRQVEVWRAEGLSRVPDHDYLPIESISIDICHGDTNQRLILHDTLRTG